MTMTTEQVITLLYTERTRQKVKWDEIHDQRHTREEWIALTCRYIGRAVFQFDLVYKESLVKAGAVIVAALEHYEKD